jgi:hypothetical protein
LNGTDALQVENGQRLRIGTWNLAGRWDERHAQLLYAQACDVWLLTEVSERLNLDGFALHATAARMAARRHWAAVLSREPLVARPDPHPASALADVGRLTFCSSILPWRSCGGRPPWVGDRHADRTGAAVDDLLRALPSAGLVWGGDWNHALAGPEHAGSEVGRTHIKRALAKLGLRVPTAGLPNRLAGLGSIDHIAVPQAATVLAARRVDASSGDKRLSDHDAYVVDLAT